MLQFESLADSADFATVKFQSVFIAPHFELRPRGYRFNDVP